MRSMAAADFNERRLITGYLDHVGDGKIAKRWSVLEKSASGESMILRLFKDDKETQEKHTYVLGKENFIGTERGSINLVNKGTRALYWAIITVHDQTLLFQDSHNSVKSISTFEKWDKILKDFWKHQSWLVTPLEGTNCASRERGLTLHINWASVCLAYLNPPRHYLQWYMDTIENVSCDNTKLTFSIIKDNNKELGYYVVKTEKERFACKIKSVIEQLRSRYLGITSPEQTKNCCLNEHPRLTLELPNGNTHQKKRPPNSPSIGLCLPHNPESPPIDETTGENIHMDPHALFTSYINLPKSLPNTTCLGLFKTSPEPKSVCVPTIKIVPASVALESKRTSELLHTHAPSVPQRTNCTPGKGTTSRCENPPTVHKGPKGLSSSTGKLPDAKVALDPVWDPTAPHMQPPTVPRKKKADSPDAVSAVHLPLPKPPVPSAGATPSNEKPGCAKKSSPDDYDSIGDSMSSITSQTSDAMSMDMSISSLSSEEDRHRCQSADFKKDNLIRKSVSSLGVPKSAASGASKNPGYFRSFSGPADLVPHHHHHHHHHHHPHQFTESIKSLRSESLGNGSGDYINLSNPSMNHSIDEDENLYINTPSKESHYVNPSVISANFSQPTCTCPPVPSRVTKKVEIGSGCGSMLHEVLDAMLKRDEQGGTMGLPLSCWLRFCLMCDIEGTPYKANNWKGLAEKLGLSCTDILLIDDYSRRYHKKPTQVVLCYWEKQKHPERPYNPTELKAMLRELERNDLLEILI